MAPTNSPFVEVTGLHLTLMWVLERVGCEIDGVPDGGQDARWCFELKHGFGSRVDGKAGGGRVLDTGVRGMY
jgi:hypothetical protein